MSISSISSTTNSSYVASSSNNDVSGLESQKKSLQAQIQQVNSGKDDAKTKQAKIATLQSQIQQIDSEIQLKQSSKTTNQKVQPSKGVDSNSNDVTKSGSTTSASASNTTDNIIDVLA
jgi:predicted  nucleic acid-binding Zn-ribbon protein